MAGGQKLRVGREKFIRVGTREAEQLRVFEEVGDRERELAALRRAEELARAAQLEVLLADLKAVGGRGHDVEASCRVLGTRIADQVAEGFVAAATDAPAQLV